MTSAALEPAMQYLSVSEAARLLDLSAQRTRQLVDSGELRAVKTTLGRLIDPAAALELAEQRATRSRGA